MKIYKEIQYGKDFELCDEYEVQAENYTRADQGSYWQPPEEAEVEIGQVLLNRHGSQEWEEVPLGHLLERYAAECDVTMEKAEDMITEELLEECEGGEWEG